MPSFRGYPACECLAEWLPWYEKVLLKRAVIKYNIDVYQLIGSAKKSAGTHSKGGCYDIAQTSTEALRVAREMGAAAWARGPKQNMIPHQHGALKGCPHMVPAARGQVVDCDNGGDGLIGSGRDDGPRNGIHWPLRTWRDGVAWAKAYVGDDDEERPVKPSDILDLSCWKLQVLGKDIKQPALDNYSTWHMNASGDGVAFRACAGDPTTKGSSYPRSELREMKPGGKDNASWSTTRGTHTLKGRTAIGRFPKNRPIVVFAQIHDTEDDVLRVLAKKHGDHANLYASWSLGKGKGSEDALIGRVKIGARFTWQIHASAGKVVVSIGGTNKAVRKTSRSGCYYKAGSYVQSNTRYDRETEYGGVLIYQLEVHHD